MKTSSAPAPLDPAASRIHGSGEMADLTRAFDWSSTPLGPIAGWPETLLISVNLLLSSRHPMFLWWGPEHIQFYNDAYRPSFGKGKHPRALGQTARECWTENWEYVEPRLNSVMLGGEATWFENQLVPILRNGRLEDVYWTWSDSPVRDAAGNVTGVFVTCSETTDRVLAERELDRNRERLQLALEAADLGTWTYDESTGLSTGDAAMLSIFSSPQASGDFAYWITFVHPDDRQRVGAEFAAAIAGKSPYESEYRIVRPDGETRWLRSKGRLRSDDKNPDRLVVIVEDITQRKLAEIQLHASARDFREAQRIGKMGSWHLVLATGELTWSDEVYRLMEREPGLPVMNYAKEPEIIESESGRRLQAAIDKCIATGQAYELDVKMYLHSGKTVWLATRGEPVFGADGKVCELRGTVRDITDRKLAEEALSDSEERLRLALEAARDMGTFDWDIPRDIARLDERFCAIFGIDPEYGRTGMPMADALVHVHQDDLPQVERSTQHSLDTGNDFALEYRTEPTPDRVHWVTTRANCIRAEDGTPLRMTGVVLDITERKLSEAALLRNEKLAAVGRLASSIAHEINNPLESVTNLLYLARTAKDKDNITEYLETAESELRRASAITSTTLRFHRQATRPAEVVCDELIADVLGIHQSRMNNTGVAVERRTRSTRPVFCSDGEIRQVLSNLIGNAIDAMQSAPHSTASRLLVRTRETHNWRTGADGVVVTVADTGPGMNAGTAAHIFEAFYTTKGDAGTGLGLWISKEIVDRHQGRLAVRSSQRPGRSGTVFTLFLPHHAAEA